MPKNSTITPRNEGSVMVLALCVCAILGLGIGSYLLLVRAQARNVSRSQDWNRSLVLAEAGVEEALAQLNPGVNNSNSSVVLSANGWGSPSGGIYGPKSRNFSNDLYTVLFTDTNPPVIYSTGQVTSADSLITRVIEVHTLKTHVFSIALATKLNINMNGNGIYTDSFDSGNTNLSTNGMFTPGKTSTNGGVASIGGLIDVGSATVNGDVYLGPTADSSVNNNGTITGTIYHDFNADFPDVVLPIPVSSFFSTSPLSTASNIDSVAYNYVFTTSGDYSIASSGNIYVAPGANVRLFVSSSLSPDQIRVASSGSISGNLQLYLAGSQFTLTGKSTVDSGLAANLGFWGLPSNTGIKFSASADFTGTIYAPEADLTLSGGGSSTYHFVGSSVTRSATLSGHYQFHFDEALAKYGPIKGYAATSWHEL